ncbi:MAG: dTMP kinase [Planctomycetota bacterium]
MNGLFIVIDGVDGAGKSTQALRIVDYYKNRGAVVQHLREPGGTRYGEAIRTILLSNEYPRGTAAEVLGFFAARAQLLEERILPSLERGEIVICERWVSSTYAYQSAAFLFDSKFVENLETLVVRRNPDLLIILDLPVADSLARIRGELDGIERRGKDYFERVRAGFHGYAARRGFVKLVNGAGTENEVFDRILPFLKNGTNPVS